MSHGLTFGASQRPDTAPDRKHWRPITEPYSTAQRGFLQRAVTQLRGCRILVHQTPDGDSVIYRHISEYVDKRPELKPEPKLEARA